MNDTKCPACKELIDGSATICPFCRTSWSGSTAGVVALENTIKELKETASLLKWLFTNVWGYVAIASFSLSIWLFYDHFGWAMLFLGICVLIISFKRK